MRKKSSFTSSLKSKKRKRILNLCEYEMRTMAYSDTKKIIQFKYGGRLGTLYITTDWFVDATIVAKFFNKRLRRWLTYYKKVIDSFQFQSKRIIVTKKLHFNGRAHT